MRTHICISILSVVIVAAAPTAAAQTIPELARTKPSNPIVRGVLRDVTPVPLETLSKEATLIVVGHLVFSRSYLTADEEHILSDYAIRADRVLAGDLSLSQSQPGASATPTLSMYGGELTIQGVKVATVDHNLNPPEPGQTYLMFLKRFGTEPGRYQVVRGALFAVENDRMRSVLKRGGMYKDVTDLPLPAAVLEVARARRR